MQIGGTFETSHKFHIFSNRSFSYIIVEQKKISLSHIREHTVGKMVYIAYTVQCTVIPIFFYCRATTYRCYNSLPNWTKNRGGVDWLLLSTESSDLKIRHTDCCRQNNRKKHYFQTNVVPFFWGGDVWKRKKTSLPEFILVCLSSPQSLQTLFPFLWTLRHQGSVLAAQGNRRNSETQTVAPSVGRWEYTCGRGQESQDQSERAFKFLIEISHVYFDKPCCPGKLFQLMSRGKNLRRRNNQGGILPSPPDSEENVSFLF